MNQPRPKNIPSINTVLKKEALFVGLVYILLILIGIYGQTLIHERVSKNLKNHLWSMVNTTEFLIKKWSKDKINDSRILASNPLVVESIVTLVEKTENKPLNKEQLLDSQELTALRKTLKSAIKIYNYAGFVLFDLKGRQIGALLDDPVGRSDLMERSDFFQRARNRSTVISLPFPSEVALPVEDGTWKDKVPTMFVATPVYHNNKMVAVIAFRLKPEVSFYPLFIQSRIGYSGETYAFDRQGLLLTKSRFNDHLRQLKLISKTGQDSPLNVEIRDPGGNLLEGFKAPLPRKQQPLTHMVKQALSKEKSINIEGYNDYRGVPVVGAWVWLESLNFGFTHEMDFAEAYAPVRFIKNTVMGIFSLLLISVGLGFFFRLKKLRSDAEVIQQERKFNDSERVTQAMMENAMDGIIIIDENGYIQSVNSATELMFGFRKLELVGKNINVLVPEPHRSEHDAYLKNYMESGRSDLLGLQREVRGLHKDGHEIPLELSASPIHLEDRLLFSGIVKDISKRKLAEVELVNAWKNAEKANQAKSSFLSRMSHELRTPLNAILGFAQIMEMDKKNSLPSSHKGRVNNIISAGKHLLSLINDILDLSKIESGNMNVSIESVELKPLLDDLITLTAPMAHSHKIEVCESYKSFPDVKVHADVTRLKQVLINLTSNAIKYNRHEGTVTVGIEDRPHGLVRIFVRDTGPGISPEDQRKLFKPFSRLDPDSEIEGTGIGLALCKNFVELMKGTLELESMVGEGSCFYFDLLKVKEEEAERIPQSTAENIDSVPVSQEHGYDKPTVLHVDDNPFTVKLVKTIMEQRPHIQLIQAEDGQKALELARLHNPSLILLDIHLPDSDGEIVFLRLQNLEETRDIPVVGLSAYNDENDIKKYLDRGFKEFLSKPFSLEQFLGTIDSYIKPVEENSSEDHVGKQDDNFSIHTT